MTWTTNPYCTRADVIMALDPNMTTVDYPFIDQLIPQAQTDLDREIGYQFQQDGTILNPVSRTYDGSGDAWLPIDDLIQLVTAPSYAGCTPSPCGQVIETFQYATFVNGVWILGNPSITDISADTLLRPANFTAIQVPATKMVRQSGLPYQEGRNNYVVWGVWGQPILPGQIYPGIPNDVMRACIRLVSHYYRMRDTAYADLVQAQGGIREHYTKGWPDDVLAIVRKYRHQRFYSRAPYEGTGWVFYSGN